MPSDISASLRHRIRERAHNQCEYCLLPQKATLHKHEPDHIVPRQHGGKTKAGNLALSCMRCNRYKGPNVGSFDPDTGKLVQFFNPRSQKWNEHFELQGAIIHPLTGEGRVTVIILRLNEETRVTEREHLLKAGLYV